MTKSWPEGAVYKVLFDSGHERDVEEGVGEGSSMLVVDEVEKVDEIPVAESPLLYRVEVVVFPTDEVEFRNGGRREELCAETKQVM